MIKVDFSIEELKIIDAAMERFLSHNYSAFMSSGEEYIEYASKCKKLQKRIRKIIKGK